MRKKITQFSTSENKVHLNFTKGLLLLFGLILLVSSCKKELMMEQQKSPKDLSLVEAKAFFEENFKGQKPISGKSSLVSSGSDSLEQQPMWDGFQYRELSSGNQAVLAPLHVEGRYIKISEDRMVKYGFLNYLMMYKDSSGDVVTEWVTLLPSLKWIDSKTERKYDGTIIIRDWQGNAKKVFHYVDGISSENKLVTRSKTQAKQRDEEVGTGPVDVTCVTVTTITKKKDQENCPECENNVNGVGAGKGGGDYELNTSLVCAPDNPNGPIGPTGSESDSWSSGKFGSCCSSATPPSDYVPSSCNSDPDYTVPTIPPPAGTDYMMPCSFTDMVTAPLPVNVEPNTPADNFTLMTGIELSPEEEGFLNGNPKVLQDLGNYLELNGTNEESTEFVKWAVEYLMTNAQWESFYDVFLSGPKEIVFEDLSFENTVLSPISSRDYEFNGISTYFSESEFNNYVDNLSNDFTGDAIELYMLACYKNSKLLNSTTYSRGGNQLKIGEYYLTPHFNSQNNLVFYTAFRNSSFGIEYIIKASALNTFKEKYSTYKAAANLFYVNGRPSAAKIQIAAGDYWEGLLNSYKESFTDPRYYLYLAHVFVRTAVNLKTVPNTNEPIKFTSSTIRNTKEVSVTIENLSVQQYRNAISQKYNASWKALGDGKYILEVGQNRYVSYPIATSTEGPTIQYFRNGKSIGKFRFHN